jgi:hypothetical protein
MFEDQQSAIPNIKRLVCDEAWHGQQECKSEAPSAREGLFLTNLMNKTMNEVEKIEHVEASVKVFFTRKYGMFKSILGNRDLNPVKIKRIIRDIENGLDMLKYCPIIVDREMNVIDGQHRLFVAKQVGSNVYYMITDHITLVEIAKLNSNTDKWKYKDFINCYIVQGKDDYRVLEDFIKKNSTALMLSANLLMYGGPRSGTGGSVKNYIEQGEFQVKFLAYAEKLMSTVDRFSTFEGYKDRYFIGAVHNLLNANKCQIDDLLAKFHQYQSPLEKCKSMKDYMSGLEMIYNYKNQNRRVIF